MIRLKKTIIVLLMLPAVLLGIYEPVQAMQTIARFNHIIARSALLAEVDSGTVLFDHNMRTKQPVGDFAKIMTLLLAAEAVQEGKTHTSNYITMTETAWVDIGENSSTRNILPEEEMSFLDLMYSAYVGHANEACNMIAIHLTGSIENFVVMMNNRAAEIGCENTTYVNPHGQYSSSQYTTARDQFLIFSEAINNELFLEISGTIRHITEETNMAEPRRLINPNSLLNQTSKYYYRHLITGATSVTSEGGFSYIGYAEFDGLPLIAVILGSDSIVYEDESADMRNLTEARRLFDWGFTNFGIRVIISSTELVGRVPVEHGAGADFVNLRPESSIELLLDNNIPIEEFTRDIIIYSELRGEPLVAPITAGEVLGEVKISHDGFEYGTILLLANTNIELHSIRQIRMQIEEVLETPIVRNIFFGLLLLVLIYVALLVRYNLIRRKRMMAIKRQQRKILEERQKRFTEENFE